MHWIPWSPSSPWGRRGRPLYICTYSVPQPSLPQSLPPHRPREKGHAKVGQSGSTVLRPSLPAWLPGPCVSPLPKALGASGQKARVGFALFCSSDSTSLLHHFPLVPVRVWGLGKRADLCSYFHTFSVLSGVESFPPLPSPPPVTLWLGECLCMFPSPWWEIVWLNPCPPPTPALVSRGVERWGHLFKKTVLL